MAEVEPQVQVPAAGNVPDSVFNLADASGSGSGTHGIHEAAGFEVSEENVLSGNSAYDAEERKGKALQQFSQSYKSLDYILTAEEIKDEAAKSPISAKTNMPGKSLAKTNGSSTVVKKVWFAQYDNEFCLTTYRLSTLARSDQVLLNHTL
jgi:hypothetical protein